MKKIKKIVFCCAFSFVMVLAISVYSFVKLADARRQNAKSLQTISAMNEQKNNLEKNIENMKSDEYLDEQAREKLNMIKDGETIYFYD